MSTSSMTSSKSATSHSIFGNCPQCEGLVKVSAKSKPSYTVECPHCSHRFQLIEMTDLAVPELKLVEDQRTIDVSTSSKSSTSSTAAGISIPVVDRELYDEHGNVRKNYTVPPQLAKGAKRGRNRSHRKLNARFEPRSETSQRIDTESSEGYLIDSEIGSRFSSTKPLDWSPSDFSGSDSGDSAHSAHSAHSAGTMGVVSAEKMDRPTQGDPQRPSPHLHRSTTNRRRRRTSSSQSSGLMEGIKVVLGGLLAVPLAYLIVMWFLGQDPLKIAPTIQQYAPFAVPEKMRVERVGDSIEVENQEDGSSNRAGSDRSTSDESEEVPFDSLENLPLFDFEDYPDSQP